MMAVKKQKGRMIRWSRRKKMKMKMNTKKENKSKKLDRQLP